MTNTTTDIENTFYFHRGTMNGFPEEITKNSELQLIVIIPDPQARIRKQQIHEIPKTIGDLHNLRVLRMTDCLFHDLPSEMEQLTELRELKLDNTLLNDFPPVIAKLNGLKKLSLANCALKEINIPTENLRNLRCLDLSGNLLGSFPEAFCSLPQLTWLDLSGNNKRESIEEGHIRFHAEDSVSFWNKIVRIKSLEVLKLADLDIGNVPSSITQLKQLRVLDLSGNLLSSLPPEIGDLENLEELILDGNSISDLPASVEKLTKLKILSLGNNNLNRIPANMEKLSALQQAKFYNLRMRSPNNITSLPELLLSMPSLKAFLIEQNTLTSIAPGITDKIYIPGRSSVPSAITDTVLKSDFSFPGLNEKSVADFFSNETTFQQWVSGKMKEAFSVFNIELSFIKKTEIQLASGQNISIDRKTVGSQNKLETVFFETLRSAKNVTAITFYLDSIAASMSEIKIAFHFPKSGNESQNIFPFCNESQNIFPFCEAVLKNDTFEIRELIRELISKIKLKPLTV